MSITELEKEFLDNVKKEASENRVVNKAKEEIGRVIAPVYDEIPPLSKAGKYLTEGMRSWAFIAISAIADEISTTELNLFKRVKNDWVEIENNQILDVIAKPNEIQTKEEIFWLISVFLLAEGEAPLLLDNSKNPKQFVLLNPDKLRIVYDDTNIISKYIYIQSNGTHKEIDKDLIVFIKLPSLQTPFRGQGMLKHIAQTLDIDNYIEEYLRYFFYNDANPGSVLETDKELSDTAYKRLQANIRIKHQGVKKAHKNLILEGGLKWKEIGSKLNELQVKDLNDGIRDKILAAFKVPKSILGITEDVNRSNGEVSDRVFAKRCVRPKLRLIQAQLNMFFIPKFSDGQNLWLEFENPVKDDELIQAQVDEIYVKNGIWTVDEVRSRMEMLPIEESRGNDDNNEDEIVDEENVEKIYGKKHPNPSRINKFKGIILFEKEKKTVEKQDNFVEVMKSFLKENNKEIKKEFTKEEKDNFHTKKLEFTDKIEEDYKKVLRNYFSKVEESILKQIKLYNKKAVKVDYNEELEAKVMAEISIPFIEETILKQGALTYELLGLSDQVIDPQDKLVRNFIKSRTLKLGKSTSQTTTEDVDRILKIWAEEEGTIADLRKMIKEYFGSNERVDVIARTEVSRAAGFAQETVYKEVGAVSKKWLTAKDEKVCEFCGEMDGKSVGVSDTYWLKGDTMIGSEGGKLELGYESIETPPLHPSCRCDLLPVFEESKTMENFKKKNSKNIEISLELEKQREQLRKKELDLIEKEQNIAKKEEQLSNIIKETEEKKKKAKRELAKIEKIKKEIDG